MTKPKSPTVKSIRQGQTIYVAQIGITPGFCFVVKHRVLDRKVYKDHIGQPYIKTSRGILYLQSANIIPYKHNRWKTFYSRRRAERYVRDNKDLPCRNCKGAKILDAGTGRERECIFCMPIFARFKALIPTRLTSLRSMPCTLRGVDGRLYIPPFPLTTRMAGL